MKLLSKGAEASVFEDAGSVVKRREPKGYRTMELDSKLRVFRTKREAKILGKLKVLGIPAPKLIATDEKAATIRMELIDGEKARDVLDSGNCRDIGGKIGRAVAGMHGNDIIHGDLTTSNMILNNGEVYFVDFGLGFFSDKEEDKAVDLHLIRQALNSSHNEIAEKCFEAAINSYRENYGKADSVLKRLEKVEARGRYKGKRKNGAAVL